MPTPISQQVVVLTGASSPLGRATADRMLRLGASLVLATVDERAGQELMAQFQPIGARARVVVADLADRRELQRIAEFAVRNFGRIDTWINAAVTERLGMTHQTDEFRQVVDAALMSPVYGTQVARTQFSARGFGTIINIDPLSVPAWGGVRSAYVASSSALRGFSEAIAVEMWRESHAMRIQLMLRPSAEAIVEAAAGLERAPGAFAAAARDARRFARSHPLTAWTIAIISIAVILTVRRWTGVRWSRGSPPLCSTHRSNDLHQQRASIIRNAYIPTVQALREAGIEARNLPQLQRIRNELRNRLYGARPAAVEQPSIR